MAADSRAENARDIPIDGFTRTLFAGLENADNRVRRHAGYILCQTAHSNTQLRQPIIRGLAEWAVRRPYHDPVLRTLATIGQQYESSVQQALLAATDRRQARMIYRRLSNIRIWQVSLDRETTEAGETLVDVGGAGMVRVPRELLEAYSGSGTRARPSKSSSSAELDIETDHTQTSTPSRSRSWARLSRRNRVDRMPHGSQFAAIEEVCQFDELEFLGQEQETRYGHTVRTRTFTGASEDIAIFRLYRHHNRPGFEQAVGQQLERWMKIETPGIAKPKDWGVSPRPWIATEFTEQTLWERGKLDPEEALKTARDLTGTLATLHRNDMMHGGIDPHSIRYPSAIFRDRAVPKLENVGLTPVYRRFDNPASYIDPRYGAPEYYDGRFGSIDHWTDIYQLGMALYSAFTGDPPYSGSFDDIRNQVISDRPLGMSTDNPDLPGDLATVLTKATARSKLERYETAVQLHNDICRLCDDYLEE